MNISTKLFALLSVAVCSLTANAQYPTNPPAVTWSPSEVGVIYAADQEKFTEVMSDIRGNAADQWSTVSWGQTCVISDDEVGDGYAAKRIDNLDFLPLQFKATLDMSAYRFLHVDLWVSESCQLDFTFQEWTYSGKYTSAIYSLEAGKWNSIDIDLSSFTWNNKNGAQERIVNVFKLGGENVNTAEHPYAKTIYMTNIMVHNDESKSGIDDIISDEKDGDGQAYNILGQPVGDDYKGIVIIDGKKYLRK